MSKEDLNCKLRFKAVENFLRRVAFNLGNTPSQTEVKIISCIPIDVTDLQQKICSLEKELEDAKKISKKESTVCPSNPCAGVSIVQAAVGAPTSRCNAKGDDRKPDGTFKDSYCHGSSVSFNYDNSPYKQRQRSSCSFSCRSQPSRDCQYCSDHVIYAKRNKCYEKNHARQNFFSRKKNKSKRKKCNAQVVYYAQTNERTPFNSYSYSDDFSSKHAREDARENVALSKTFLHDMFQRQYRPEPILKVFSHSSNFSAPVCRDIALTCTSTSRKCKYESELCSCCVGPYRNIDRFRNKANIIAVPKPIINKGNSYYDSNHYDLVPVKQNASKIKNNIKVRHINEMPPKKKDKRKITAIHNPKDKRPDFIIPPMVVNYQSTDPVRTFYKKNIPVKIRSKKKIVAKEMTTQATTCRLPQPPRDSRLTRMCCIDYGPVYRKQIMNQNISANICPIKNNVSCPVTASNQTECPKPPSSEYNAPIDKTEITLNQIKAILQSVLFEVKTNSKVVKPTDPLKKDAIVQNGFSQSKVNEGSQFLHSFTHSPYITSCSRQMHSSNNTPYPVLPGGPVKCMQHYPILIQPQKHCCSNCYRNTNQTKSFGANAAYSAATNTEHCQVPKNETEHLIKEIYKSIAMNLEIPRKNINDNNNIKFAAQNSAALGTQQRDANKDTKLTSVSEIFKNTTHLDSSATRNTNTTFASKPTSHEVSVGSVNALPKIQPAEAGTAESSDDNETGSEANDKVLNVAQISQSLDSDEHRGDDVRPAIVNQETESSSTETESDDIVIEMQEPAVEKKKKGLFAKMLKIFKLKENHKSNKNESSIHNAETDSESDSDDYQTVYSHKATAPRPRGVNIRSRPHSKVVNSKRYQQTRSRSPDKATRRSPYMEQEHRRYWNENLSFHDNDQRYNSSMRSRETGHRAPSYAHNYEARAAFMKPTTTAYSTRQNPPQNYLDYGINSHLKDENMNNYTRNAKYNYPGDQPFPSPHPNPFHQGIWINYPGNINNCQRYDKPRIITPRINDASHKVTTSKGLSWLKKRKLGSPCGQQWKRFIVES